MDGEVLLERLKDGGEMGSVLPGIERFYAPVSNPSSKLAATVANKYGVFAMKALRACIQRLTQAKLGSKDLAGIIQITEQSYQCVCKARKHIKTVPLALEKLLFHTMLQTVNKRLLSDALRIASLLYDELAKSRTDFLTASGVDNEYDTIVKQAFNQLWKACLELEQSSQHTIKHSLILNVRLQALKFLMLTDYECSWVVERALRAALDFDRKSSKSGADQEQLHIFLTTVLSLLLGKDSKVMKDKGNLDKHAGPLLELGLPAIKFCIQASKYDRAIEVCHTLLDFFHMDSKGSKKESADSKGSKKESGIHCQCLNLVKSALQYKQHMSAKTGKNKSKSNHASVLMNSLADAVQNVTESVSKVLEKSCVSGSNLNNLLEACEILKKSLEGPSDGAKQDKSASAAMIPSELQDPMYGAMMMYVDLLQVQREKLAKVMKGSREAAKSHNQQMQRNVNRQLGTLEYLSTMMLESIKTSSQDDSKDSEDCLERAVKICNRTKSIIDDVATGGGGSLSTDENRWFGSNAYNVGLVCYRKKYYNQSAVLLEIACNQLQTWCYVGNKLDMEKLTKVQLATRYELLIDCQRKAGEHQQAMQTVVKCLWNVCSHVTDHVTPCIELWVKAKRDALKEDDSDQLQSRTLFDAIKEMDGASLSDDHRGFITMLLKKELQGYKSARHDTMVEQHSVVCDLLNLNSSDDTKLAYCHGLVEQAQLLRIGNFETDKSASECCSEAIDMLTEVAESESMSSNGEQGLPAFDILATAYFWMYVCQMEDIQGEQGLPAFDILAQPTSGCMSARWKIFSYKMHLKSPESPADSTNTKPTGGLGRQVAYTLGMEHGNMKYLDMALGIWADLLCSGFKPEVFHELSVTTQCMKLMASLYELAKKPLQQLQSLHLLSILATASGNTSQSLYAFCQISSALCHLGETKLAGHIMRKAEDIMERVDGGAEDAGRKSLDRTCMLAKAQYLLYSGQFDKFQNKLEKLIQAQTSERNTYHTYLQKASIKELQAKCMEVNPEVMTSTDLCPEGLTALDMAVEAKQLCMGVCSNLLGEYFCNSREQTDGAKAGNTSFMDSNCQEDWYDQWSILSAVLESLLHVGKIYCQQGCIREAECYLHEGLVISNQYLLPRRCAEFSLQLSKVYTMRGQQSEVQLSQMKQFVDSSTKETKPLCKNKQIDALKKGARRISSRASSFGDSDDENFIQTKRLSLTEILSDDEMTSSPTLKTRTASLPEYHKHGLDCGCESCNDAVLHGLDLEYFVAQARTSAMQGDFVEALSELDTATKFSVWITNHDEKIVHSGLNMLVEADKQSSKKNKNSRVVDRCLIMASVHDQGKLDLQSLKAWILLQQNKAIRAQQCISTGLAMFSKEISPVMLAPATKAELHYYQIMANVMEQGCDMFATVWKSLQNQIVEPGMEDLATEVGKLDLGGAATGGAKSKSGPGRWQDRLKGAAAGRPELARHDLITPASQMIPPGGIKKIGIFCDVSDNEDSIIKYEGASAIISTPKAMRPKSATAMKMSTKKGVFSYSVKKTKSAKKVTEKDPISAKTPLNVFSLDNDVFDFNSPSTTAKKSKITRKVKSTRAVSSRSTVKSKQKAGGKVTFSVYDDGAHDDEILAKTGKKSSSVVAVDTDDNIQESVSKSTTKKRSTGARPKRKPPVVLSESEPDLDQEESKIVPDVDVKPKGRGGRRKTSTQADESQGASTATKKPTRPRRGRKANIENARAEDDQLGFDSLKMVMESTGILPIDTPDHISDVSGTFDDLDLSLNAAKDSSSSPVTVSVSSAVSDMLLEDIDEIEIPRAGPDSDPEDVSVRRKRTTTKKAGGRRRGTKKTKETEEEEDGVEMMRTATCGSDDVSTKQKKKKVTAGVKQNMSSLSGSDLGPIIEQLQQVYKSIKHSAPLVLYRQVCHMLSLCYGDQSPELAVYYLNEAMSVTLRHKKLSSLQRKIKKLKKESSASDVDQLTNNLSQMSLIPDNDKNKKKNKSTSAKAKQKPMSKLDILEDDKKMFAFHDGGDENSIVHDTISALPEGWTVCMLSIVSPSVCSSKIPSESDYLVVSRMAQGKESFLLKIPLQKDDFGFSKSAQDILSEFDAILLENKESVKETDKKIWWTCRQKLDERMETLTKDMEGLFSCWKGVLLGQKKDVAYRKQLVQCGKELKTVMKTKCQVDIDEHLCECLLASCSHLSPQQLGTTISQLSSLQADTDEHTELMGVFKQLMEKLPSGGAEENSRHPVVLVLDKQIQQLPWENMALVRDQPMCRMPGLHFISSHLKMVTQAPDSVLSCGVDTSDTFFVLNPTNDLANTQKTFQKWFEKENGWEGVVARAPTKEEYMSALTDHDLFVYCGHGNGRDFLTGDDMLKLICQAATLLIGCSSGKLHVNGTLEAYGMTLNYIVSGCPCVVANLWDVTDKDIDRFLEVLLKSWLASDQTTSLTDYISQSRQACKLQYLIGCSPVVYGLPVHIKK